MWSYLKQFSIITDMLREGRTLNISNHKKVTDTCLKAIEGLVSKATES